MNQTFKLKQAKTIRITKRIRCKDCDNYITIGSLAYNVFYVHRELQHLRIVCGCCDIPVKWCITMTSDDENKSKIIEKTLDKPI
jgi:RNase P subunit RPR2